MGRELARRCGRSRLSGGGRSRSLPGRVWCTGPPAPPRWIEGSYATRLSAQWRHRGSCVPTAPGAWPPSRLGGAGANAPRSPTAAPQPKSRAVPPAKSSPCGVIPKTVIMTSHASVASRPRRRGAGAGTWDRPRVPTWTKEPGPSLSSAKP